MLGKPVDRMQDVERWHAIAVREAEAAERRLAQAQERVMQAERALEEARARYEVDLACALAARAWRTRMEQERRRAPVPPTVSPADRRVTA